MDDLVHIQLVTDAGTEVPDEEESKGWVTTVFMVLERKQQALTVRIVGEPEMTALNLRYRNNDRSTNVLSFPFEPPPGMLSEVLGDIAICAAVVEREAILQEKPLLAHWAHIIVHGILHLCGYDHQQDHVAVVMETLEVSILETLGFPDPYQMEPRSYLNEYAQN